MESKNIQGIQRKIKEIAKDYKSKGYEVFIEPNYSILPDFLRNFNADLIALSENDNVIVEVKSSDSQIDYKILEELANIVNSKQNWRFEMVFTNPKKQSNLSNSLTLIDSVKIDSRLVDINNLVENNSLEPAFLLGWATLEASIRTKLITLKFKEEILQKAPLHLLKSLYSLGVINQTQLKKLEVLNQKRNQIIHGFQTTISKNDVYEAIDLINILNGKGDTSDLYEWLSYQDLENYEDIYCLYRAIAEIDEYGMFSAYKKGESIFVKSDLMDDEEEELELINETQVKEILEIIEEDYMDGMHAEGFYAFHNAMDKND